MRYSVAEHYNSNQNDDTDKLSEEDSYSEFGEVFDYILHYLVRNKRQISDHWW